ncbi:Ankyrin Repeat [Seminavis robusta]|uniref:Ankyrin Repeat n=1 Tax=Seminavis robusta TaxID=568900 RepID=A0A9N8HH80_9STRA|nr:Ankyrin Repeat [Seminavis robusta]|eukprot:Sro548_g164320.1 Ankyrin Repeat (426) ;mRNA; f:4076-5353
MMNGHDMDLDHVVSDGDWRGLTRGELRESIPLRGDPVHVCQWRATGKIVLKPACFWKQGDSHQWKLLQRLKQKEYCRHVQVRRQEWLLPFACTKGVASEVLDYIIQSDPESIGARWVGGENHEGGPPKGSLPLHCACSALANDSNHWGRYQLRRFLASIQFLLEADTGAAMDNENSSLELPIHILLSGRQQEVGLGIREIVVEDLVEAHPKALETKNGHGHLPLHLAVLFQSTEIVQFLVWEYPAAACVQDNQGNLPFTLAVEARRPMSILLVLLRAFPQVLAGRSKKGCPGRDSSRQFLLHGQNGLESDRQIALFLRQERKVVRSKLLDCIESEERMVLKRAAKVVYQELAISHITDWMSSVSRNLAVILQDDHKSVEDSGVHECVVPLLEWVRHQNDPVQKKLEKLAFRWDRIARLAAPDGDF